MMRGCNWVVEGAAKLGGSSEAQGQQVAACGAGRGASCSAAPAAAPPRHLQQAALVGRRGAPDVHHVRLHCRQFENAIKGVLEGSAVGAPADGCHAPHGTAAACPGRRAGLRTCHLVAPPARPRLAPGRMQPPAGGGGALAGCSRAGLQAGTARSRQPQAAGRPAQPLGRHLRHSASQSRWRLLEPRVSIWESSKAANTRLSCSD